MGCLRSSRKAEGVEIMTAPEAPQINLLGLGIRSVAMQSLLKALPRDVNFLEDSESAQAAIRNVEQPLVIDGAVSPPIAATKLRKLGVVELLAERIKAGAPLLVSGEAAVSMASGRLQGAIRGLGLLPAQLVRFPRPSGSGVRAIAARVPQKAWFDHEYLFVTEDQSWSAGESPTGLLARGKIRVCAFDAARSAGFGRVFVANWVDSDVSSREEAA